MLSLAAVRTLEARYGATVSLAPEPVTTEPRW